MEIIREITLMFAEVDGSDRDPTDVIIQVSSCLGIFVQSYINPSDREEMLSVIMDIVDKSWTLAAEFEKRAMQ